MLSTGTRLGRYEIVSTLGAGGMGEVYCARDETLNRDVALKVLPARFALDADRLARFKREAQILASLNHTNIAAIYGFEEASGVHALVLELVDGPTLADRLALGPIPIDDTLAVARQIAEALEAAHEHGVVHRDLKPSNIKLRPDGTVKVLDFGLAKALEPAGATSGDATASPTITSPAVTQTGVILGTAAYMSPEQAKGRTADRRSDLWAFGCVLYEMLTGTRAFKAEDVPDTLAAVLTREPDWHALPATTPPSIDRLLKRCLAKNVRDRIADASTARLEIESALAPSASGESRARAPRQRPWQRASVAWSTVAALLLVAVVLGVIEKRRNARVEAPVFRAVIPNPDNAIIGAPQYLIATQGLSIALSPNADHIAFIASGATGPWRLWVRPLAGGAARPLAGTEGGTRPFWSADGRSLGFVADKKVKRVDIDGGPVLTICDHPSGIGGGGTWSADGIILFSSAVGAGGVGPIYRVAASGGTATPVTTIEDGAIDRRHAAPSFLPDGHHFLYTSMASTSQPSVYVGSIDGPQRTHLLDGVTNVQYSQGRLLFMRGTTLMAQPFDAGTMTLSGEVVPVADGVIIDPFSRTGIFSVSTTGVLAYQGSTGIPPSQLTWLDRRGMTLGVLGEPGEYNAVNLSPDNTHAAVSMRDATGNMDIWLVDVTRGLRTRVTFDPADETQAVWSPDNAYIVFDSLRSGRGNLYQKAANGTAREELVDDSPVGKFVTSWSSDGALILYNSPAGEPKTGNDIWVLPLLPKGKPYLFLQTTFNEGRAQVAPDHRWIAYQSNESGRNDVYVAQFPGPGGKWQVSAGGGGSPRWRRDGKELFYVSADSKMMAVAVNGSGSVFTVGAARPLFTVRMQDQFYGIPYDVAADGQRFLVNTPGEQTTPASITLIINWPGLLKK